MQRPWAEWQRKPLGAIFAFPSVSRPSCDWRNPKTNISRYWARFSRAFFLHHSDVDSFIWLAAAAAAASRRHYAIHTLLAANSESKSQTKPQFFRPQLPVNYDLTAFNYGQDFMPHNWWHLHGFPCARWFFSSVFCFSAQPFVGRLAHKSQ